MSLAREYKEGKHRVTLAEAKENPEYWQFVENIFREEAARKIQNAVRIRQFNQFLKTHPDFIFFHEQIQEYKIILKKEHLTLHIKLKKDYLLTNDDLNEIASKISKKFKYHVEIINSNNQCIINKTTNEARKHQEVLTDKFGGEATLLFIEEPIDDKYKEHAEKIKKGKWVSLDFSDYDFVSNIYKALRLKLINIDQMATAYFLFMARDALQDPDHNEGIKQYSFEEKEGPYDYSKTHLPSDPSMMDEFFKKCKALNQSDQYYFSVNLSRKAIVTILYDRLSFVTFDSLGDESFLNLLKKYIDLKSKNTAILPYYEKLCHIFDEENEITVAEVTQYISRITSFMVEHEKNLADWLENKNLSSKDQKDRESMSFIAVILRSTGFSNILETSLDFDSKNPNSPLASFLILSIPVMNILQKTVYGDDVVTPAFTLGPFYPSLVRENIEKNSPSRPVEFFHPNIKANMNPHGYSISRPFSLIFHDIYHVENCSHFMCKSFLKHLRSLHTLVKYTGHFPNSFLAKSLWDLTDIEFSNPVDLLSLESVENDLVKQAMYKNIMSKTGSQQAPFFGDHSYYDLLLYDDNLLLIIDMIVNEKQWSHIRIRNTNYFDDVIPFLRSDRKINTLYVKMKEIFDIFPFPEKIFLEDPLKRAREKYIFYVLLYRLLAELKVPEDNKILYYFCCSLAKNVGLQNILKWSRNDGLMIHSEKQKKSITSKDVPLLDRMMAAAKHVDVNIVFVMELRTFLIKNFKKSKSPSYEMVEKLLNDLSEDQEPDKSKIEKYILKTDAIIIAYRKNTIPFFSSIKQIEQEWEKLKKDHKMNEFLLETKESKYQPK